VQREAAQSLPYYKERAECLVREILIHLKRHVIMFESGAQGRLEFPNHFDFIKKKRTEEVKRYLKNHIADTVRLADIADELCLSESYLSAVFKSQAGVTIMQYLEQLRIERAAELLKTTGNAVKSIAYELGYYDPYHFSRKFKMKTGYSPMGFRNRQAGYYPAERTG
jgi:AraC-like DNA-binding protein